MSSEGFFIQQKWQYKWVDELVQPFYCKIDLEEYGKYTLGQNEEKYF